MIHPGRFVSLELSVATQFFRETSCLLWRHADETVINCPALITLNIRKLSDQQECEPVHIESGL
jgi:hypothetical protein